MRKRVMIVEDEAIVALDIEQILKKNNFNVVGVANTVSKALELFNNFKVDLILCDINLGKGGSGIDLMRRIKKMNGEIQVIFLSAYSDEDTINEAFDIVPGSYITKPFTDKQLIVTIKRVFAGMEVKKIKSDIQNPTRREMQIVCYVADGLTSREIAEKLNIAFETVQTHRKNLLFKYNLSSSAELIAFAIKNGWID